MLRIKDDTDNLICCQAPSVLHVIQLRTGIICMLFIITYREAYVCNYTRQMAIIAEVRQVGRDQAV